MNDRPLDDDALDRRLRTDLDALVRAAGDPPVLASDRRERGRRPHPRAIALAAAAVLVAVAAAGLIWSATDRDRRDQRVATEPSPDPTTDGERPLAGTRWWLVRAEQDGQPQDLGGRRDLGLRLTEEPICGPSPDVGCPWTGPTLSASDACNGITRSYELPSPGTIELGEDTGATTDMACGGGLVDLLATTYGPGALRYEVRGEQLVVTRDGVVLTYEASDGPFAPVAGTLVDEGEVGPEGYQLVWNGGLTLQTADIQAGVAQGGTGLGDDPGRINTTRASIGDRAYVLAVVPIEAVRVVYEPLGGEAQELPIERVDSPTSAVVGAFVADAPDTWFLVAYDADGLELHRYRWGGGDAEGPGRYLSEVVTVAGFPDCCTPTGAREAFTADGTPMSIGGSPLEPTAPRDPAQGLTDPQRVDVVGGTAITGTVRDDAAVRFDCAGLRYEVRAPAGATDALLAVTPALSDAAGCPTPTIAEP